MAKVLIGNIKGPQGDTGPRGPQGVQGIQGEQGPAGKDFSIAKTYASIADMEADAANVEEGSFVLIASDTEDEDNARLYVKGASSFTYLGDLSGAQGMKGEQGVQGIQGLQGEPGVSCTHSWSGTTLTVTSASGTSSADLKGDKGERGETGKEGATGDKGDKGDTGVGIRSVVQTTTSTADDGNNVITVTLTDGTTSTFKIQNGSKGSTGAAGADGKDADELIPDYVREEAERVASLVQSRQGSNTITFLACSDIHHSTVNYATQMKETLAHLGQGMKHVREKVSIDFAACLGDSIWDASNETVENVQDAVREVNAALFGSFNGVPNFRLVGNHEVHYNGATKLTDAQVFANTAAFNAGAMFGDDRSGGYCYRDFEDRKLRVVCLNTSEGDETGSFVMSGAQIEWLAGVLNLSSLGDGWKSVILSHIPLDWYGASSAPLQTIKAADGVLCNVHGHIHNYLSGTLEGTSIPRFAIPNACFYRSNEYGQNGTTEYNGMEFGEETTYGKTAGTANDTAFCVVTIDLDALVAYADHYGAGYDREITLPGEAAAGYTNLVPSALDFDLDGVFNGVGYMNGKYLSTTSPYYYTDANTVTTGLIPYENTDLDTGSVFTPPTIYVKGITLDSTSSHNRIGYSRAADDGSVVSTKNASTWGEVFNVETLGEQYYRLTPLYNDSGRNLLYATWSWATHYIAFSFTGTGENLIITLDEPIE